MFSVLAVGYLFLGGAGAGAIAVASILDLVWVKAPFGHASRIGIGEATPLERAVAVGMLAGFGALALGMLFLLFDLGRIDRVASLLLRPSLSFLTVGTYALAGLAACAALLVAVRFAYLPSVPRGAVRAVEAAAAVVAVVVMLYTGLLLQNTGAVALWSSPLVPVLFLLSSLSCGIATLLLAAYFAPADAATAWLFRMLARVDALIVVLEAAAAALFVAFALADDHPGAVASAQRLAEGDLALWWWVGSRCAGSSCRWRWKACCQRAAPSPRRAERGWPWRPCSCWWAGSACAPPWPRRDRIASSRWKARRRSKRPKASRPGSNFDWNRKNGHVALFEINEKSSIPIWLQLKNRFIYLITSGYYKPGDQLPTVRGLAADVEVNYNTVSKVYMSLEQDGYIQSKRRQGAFVLDVSDKPGVSISSTAEIVTSEYLKRCFELGMSLEDIEQQFALSLNEAKTKRDAG